MFRIWADLNFDWVYRIAGDRNNVTVPLALPNSYQRQYVTLGPGVPTEGTNWEDAEQVRRIRDQVRMQCNFNMHESQELQRKDPKRYLLGKA
jgi:hypothetical protein